MNPKITIVTPSFNRCWAIPACLASIRSQHNVDYEHIIMDGGSTDGTLEYLHAEAAKDQRIRVISEADSGMYDAVNKGMKIARANIVAYLNTDDFYLPGVLTEVISAFEQTPTLAMLYGHWMSWHPEHEFLEVQPVQNYRAADLAYFAVLPQPSVFFRRSVIEQLGGFDLSFKLLADNDFFSRVAVAGLPFKRLNFFLSVQTVHSGNLLAGNSAAVIQAKQEGRRYRNTRKMELAMQGVVSTSLPVCTARIKYAMLPIAWRAQLLFKFWHAIFNRGSYLSTPWRYIEGRFSLKIMCRYLFSRLPRQFHPFFRVSQSEMCRFVGFQVPSYPPTVKSHQPSKR